MSATSCSDVKSLFTDEIIFGKYKSKVIAGNGNGEIWQHPVVVTSIRSSRKKLFSEKIIAKKWQRRSLAAPNFCDVKSLFTDEIVFGKDESQKWQRRSLTAPSCRDVKSLFTDEIFFGKDHSQKWQRKSLAAPSCRDVKSLFTDEIVFGKDKSKVFARNGNVEVWQHPVVVTSSCSSRMKLFSEKIIARNGNVEVWQPPRQVALHG